jgi:hypothetical protein
MSVDGVGVAIGVHRAPGYASLVQTFGRALKHRSTLANATFPMRLLEGRGAAGRLTILNSELQVCQISSKGVG